MEPRLRWLSGGRPARRGACRRDGNRQPAPSDPSRAPKGGQAVKAGGGGATLAGKSVGGEQVTLRVETPQPPPKSSKLSSAGRLPAGVFEHGDLWVDEPILG